MEICRSIPECRAAVAALRAGGARIGFVPTMGCLHPGHLSLVAQAQAQCEAVVVSIFVNPTQFGQPGDLANYPRTEQRDLELLDAAGVAVVFLPDAETIYPANTETIVETTRLANILHGEVRPGHFRGVTSVVTRLFNIVQPDLAVFGEKDYQQLQIIKRMVADLHVPLSIECGATVREADGLAMSSRNLRLTPSDRHAAPVLFKALEAAEQAARSTKATVEELRALITATILTEPRAQLHGLDTVTADRLMPMTGPLSEPMAIMLSVQFSDILLIDQRVITP